MSEVLVRPEVRWPKFVNAQIRIAEQCNQGYGAIAEYVGLDALHRLPMHVGHAKLRLHTRFAEYSRHSVARGATFPQHALAMIVEYIRARVHHLAAETGKLCLLQFAAMLVKRAGCAIREEHAALLGEPVNRLRFRR